MIKMKTAAAPLLALALGFASHAHAAPADYGTVNSAAGATGRVIEVTPGTRYLNVRNGEVVTVRQGDSSFTWQVSAAPNVGVIPLALVAPEGAPATEALAYVAPAEYYQNP